MKTAEMLGKSLSLDITNLSLSEEDAKDLLHDNDKDFVIEYLLSRGAKKMSLFNDGGLLDHETSTEESENMIKPCYLGVKGAQTRKEAIELIKDIIVDDPLKKGFKTGYKTAAAVLNKNGYRNHKHRKWTAKSLCGFLRSKDLSKPSKALPVSKTKVEVHDKKLDAFSVNEVVELVKHVTNSDLDQQVKFFLTRLVMSGSKLND